MAATERQATIGRQFLQDLLDFYLSPLFSTTLPTQEDALALCEVVIPHSVSSRGNTYLKPDLQTTRLVTNLHIYAHTYHLFLQYTPSSRSDTPSSIPFYQ